MTRARQRRQDDNSSVGILIRDDDQKKQEYLNKKRRGLAVAIAVKLVNPTRLRHWAWTGLSVFQKANGDK